MTESQDQYLGGVCVCVHKHTHILRHVHTREPADTPGLICISF